MPPIVIKVRDHRTFGRKPVVGRHVMKFIDLEDPPVFEMIDYKNVLLNGKKVLICYLFFVHYGLFSLGICIEKNFIILWHLKNLGALERLSARFPPRKNQSFIL